MSSRNNSARVAIVMGSKSDWATMQFAAEIFEILNVPHHVEVVSAHRTPDKLFSFAESAEENGYQVIIAGAGGAADSVFSLAANSLAWLGAVIFAYFANRRFVFRSDNSILHEFMQFALLRLASLTVENILLYLLLTLMAMPNAAAKISVSVITVILNYAACRYKIFSVKGENR